MTLVEIRQQAAERLHKNGQPPTGGEADVIKPPSNNGVRMPQILVVARNRGLACQPEVRQRAIHHCLLVSHTLTVAERKIAAIQSGQAMPSCVRNGYTAV